MKAPVYTLHCRSASGEAVRLLYSPHTSELTDEGGEPLLADVLPRRFRNATRVSPAAPGKKSRRVSTLKIQLGMRCNYSCTYCNQSSAAPDATVTRTADVDTFLAGLDQWLQGSPRRIEFWGGEPFLYFAKLKRLVPELRRRFPGAVFSVISNGSLLDAEILDFIERWDLHLMISHDGPGQHLRGPDPFEDPERAHWLRALWELRGGARGRVSFNVVLTPANADVGATRAWLAARLGDEHIALDTEGAVSVYDDRALAGAGRWSDADYALLRSSIADGVMAGDALRYRSIEAKAQDFIQSLRQRRPSTALGQKCGMDQSDQLAVDLHGKVMTCQNTGAQGRHELGHASRMEEVALNTATHWSHRECCNHCPVLQLCKGGCMFLDGPHFAQSCENEYQYNLGVLDGVLRAAAGLALESITGDIRRPASSKHRVIPIAAQA